MSLFQISFVFFISGLIFIAINYRIFFANPYAMQNRVFTFILLSVFSCSFSYAMLPYEPLFKAETWEMIATGSRMMIGPFLMHFVMVLIESKYVNKIRSYIIIYLPTVLSILLLCVSGPFAAENLIREEFAFGPVVYYKLSLIYVIFLELMTYVYLGISLTVFAKWSIIQRREKNIHKTLVGVIIAVMLCVTTTGVLTVYAFISEYYILIRIRMLFLVIASLLVMYAFHDEGFLKYLPEQTEEKKGSLLNPERRVMVNRYISGLYIAISTLHFGFDFYVSHRPFIPSLVFAFIMFLVAIVIRSLEFTNISYENKGMITAILVSLTIPLIMGYCNSGTVLFLLPFTIILMLIFILLSMKNGIIIVGLVTIGSLIYYGVNCAPPQIITVRPIDYTQGVFLFIMVMLIALYINKLYFNRIKENEYKLELQEIVADISRSYMNGKLEEFDDNINSILESIGRFANVERVGIFLLSDENALNAKLYYEWCMENEKTVLNLLMPVFIPDFPILQNALENNNILEFKADRFINYFGEGEDNPFNGVAIESTMCIPISGDAVSRSFLISALDRSNSEWGMQSSLADIIKLNSNVSSVVGFITFSSGKKDFKWTDDLKYLLRTSSGTISYMLVKNQVEKTMFNMAYYDQLTGLPNRLYLADDLNKKLKNADMSDYIIGVVLIDLDSFKYINDTLGHNEGDNVLRIVSEKIKNSLTGNDELYRFGGDEFIIIQDKLESKEDSIRRIAGVMDCFEEPLIASDQSFYITVSAGIAIYPGDGDDVDSLIKNDDMTMYVSKENGKNQFNLCSKQIKAGLESQVFLINKLYVAIEENQMHLCYQPIIRANDGVVVGLEALCRWNLPGHGPVSPGEFIPLAEKSSIINTIGYWVFETACNQIVEWNNLGRREVSVAVNVSMRQFQDTKFVKRIKEILEKTKVNPKYLNIEITEGIDFKQEQYITDILNELNAMGLAIVIDDFGMQYSSMNRIKSLHFSKLKIDMHFIRGITHNEKDRGITQTIINMAHNLNLKVVAEGVETKEQLDLLKEWGCDEIQGYYFYKPMLKDEIPPLL